MTWVKTDDSAPHHPKLVRAGAEASWFWQCGLCYSNRHHLDGRIPKDCLPALYAPLAGKVDKMAAKLFEVKLWHDRGDHIEIHDYEWHQEQAMKEVVEARQTYERDRKRAQRSGTSPGQCRDSSPGQSQEKSGTANEAAPRDTRARDRAPAPAGASPVPTRPDPSRSPLPPAATAALKASLEEHVRGAYFRANAGSQKAGDSQWADGCERASEAVEQGHFPSLDAACRALAEAAVAESLKPNGKLGFALQQAPFVAAPEPRPREYSRDDLRPRKQHPEVA